MVECVTLKNFKRGTLKIAGSTQAMTDKNALSLSRVILKLLARALELKLSPSSLKSVWGQGKNQTLRQDFLYN